MKVFLVVLAAVSVYGLRFPTKKPVASAPPVLVDDIGANLDGEIDTTPALDSLLTATNSSSDHLIFAGDDTIDRHEFGEALLFTGGNFISSVSQRDCGSYDPSTGVGYVTTAAVAVPVVVDEASQRIFSYGLFGVLEIIGVFVGEDEYISFQSDTKHFGETVVGNFTDRGARDVNFQFTKFELPNFPENVYYVMDGDFQYGALYRNGRELHKVSIREDDSYGQVPIVNGDGSITAPGLMGGFNKGGSLPGLQVYRTFARRPINGTNSDSPAIFTQGLFGELAVTNIDDKFYVEYRTKTGPHNAYLTKNGIFDVDERSFNNRRNSLQFPVMGFSSSSSATYQPQTFSPLGVHGSTGRILIGKKIIAEVSSSPGAVLDRQLQSNVIISIQPQSEGHDGFQLGAVIRSGQILTNDLYGQFVIRDAFHGGLNATDVQNSGVYQLITQTGGSYRGNSSMPMFVTQDRFSSIHFDNRDRHGHVSGEIHQDGLEVYGSISLLALPRYALL